MRNSTSSTKTEASCSNGILSDLMKQAEEHNKKLHRTKDVNIADILTWEDRDAIAKIVDNRVAKEYGDMFPFKWQFSCSGHFIC